MSVNHSEETHRNLVSRIPQVTGRQLAEWFEAMDRGPGLVRFEERVGWLRDVHEIPHNFASAIVREHDKRRVAARA